jgi:hypothetical protein
VWPSDEPKIFTRNLITRLKGIEDGPYASDEKFDSRKLGRMLRPFKMTPRPVQIGHENLRGYYRDEFQEAAAPYLDN